MHILRIKPPFCFLFYKECYGVGIEKLSMLEPESVRFHAGVGVVSISYAGDKVRDWVSKN